MSWFFGKKKPQRDSPPNSEDENPPAGQGDEFIFIERRGNPPGGPGINEGSDNNPVGNLYPNINNIPRYPPPPTDSPKHTIDPIQNILNGLPFKLCKQLADNANDDIEIDRHRVNEILAFIVRLDNDDIVYDFSTEKSVINEMGGAESAM